MYDIIDDIPYTMFSAYKPRVYLHQKGFLVSLSVGGLICKYFINDTITWVVVFVVFILH